MLDPRFGQEVGTRAGYAHGVARRHMKAAHPNDAVHLSSTKAYVIIFGTFVIGMLVLIPAWSGFRMLKDPIVLLFIGDELPKLLLGSCVGVLFVFLITFFCFFTRARPEVRTEQAVLMLGNVFIVMLSVCLILISLPLGVKSQDVSSSIFASCAKSSAAGSFPLWETSQVLQLLRADPACANLESVEQCAGYEATKYTEILKAMEERLKCSGYCYQPIAVAQNISRGDMVVEADAKTANITAENASLLQVETLGHRQVGSAIRHMALGVNLTDAPGKRPTSLVDADSGIDGLEEDIQTTFMQLNTALTSAAKIDMTIAASKAALTAVVTKPKTSTITASLPRGTATKKSAAGIVIPYPPTLFSKANYQASCDGMSARHIQYTAEETSEQIFYEGIFLTLTSVIVGMLNLFGLCFKESVRSSASICVRGETGSMNNRDIFLTRGCTVPPYTSLLSSFD